MRFFLIFFLLAAPCCLVYAQPSEGLSYLDYYKRGEYLKAVSVLRNYEYKTKEDYCKVYTTIGIIYKNAGRYDSSLVYLRKAIHSQNPKTKIQVLNNLANTHKKMGEYRKAAEILEKNLILLEREVNSGKDFNYELSACFHNLALVYKMREEYERADNSFRKSIDLKIQEGLKNLDHVYNSYSDFLFETKNYPKAEQIIKKTLALKKQESQDLGLIYRIYARYLFETGKPDSSLLFHKKSIAALKSRHGTQHPFVSSGYYYIATFFLRQNMPDSAARYINKAIEANTRVVTANKQRIVFSDIYHVRNLRLKSEIILKTASTLQDQSEKLALITKSLKNLDSALGKIRFMKAGFNDAENILQIADNEKRCRFLISEALQMLYRMSGEETFLYAAYSQLSKAKAAVLSTKIDKDDFLKARLPASDYAELKYAELKITEKKQGLRRASDNVLMCHDSILYYIEKRDSIIKQAAEMNPDFYRLQSIKQNLPISKIQRILKSNEIIADYFLKKDDRTDDSHLYVFLISRKGIKLYDKKYDSDFLKQLRYIRDEYKRMKNHDLDEYNRFNAALHTAYIQLIKPIENSLEGKKAYIIPDEEINYLSFDMLLSDFKESRIINYSNLPYLIKAGYRFNYAYSLPLLYESLKKDEQDQALSVFAPEYAGQASETKMDLGALPNQKQIIQTTQELFPTDAYYGTDATKANFKMSLQSGNIIYYSGHAFADITDYKQSALTFSDKDEQVDFLFLNEISQLEIRSPYVILSGCQTGEGRLYSGEGVIHLTHAFLSAGVHSVMHTLWEIESDADYRIMNKFLIYLSEGETKSTALYKAKLDYLNSVKDPNKLNPYYWAAYIPMGNDHPIKSKTLLSSINTLYFFFAMLIVSAFLWIFVNKQRKSL